MRDRTPPRSWGWVKLLLVACTLISGLIVYLNVRGPAPARRDPNLGADAYQKFGNRRGSATANGQSADAKNQADGVP
jgi:hypothetical protein